MNRQKNVRREKQSKEYKESCLEKQILEDNTKDRDSNFWSCFLPARPKIYLEKRRDVSLMLATIRDNTRHVLTMQHITPNSKRWGYSDIPGGNT